MAIVKTISFSQENYDRITAEENKLKAAGKPGRFSTLLNRILTDYFESDASLKLYACKYCGDMRATRINQACYVCADENAVEEKRRYEETTAKIEQHRREAMEAELKQLEKQRRELERKKLFTLPALRESLESLKQLKKNLPESSYLEKKESFEKKIEEIESDIIYVSNRIKELRGL